jgi:hypothetical protein
LRFLRAGCLVLETGRFQRGWRPFSLKQTAHYPKAQLPTPFLETSSELRTLLESGCGPMPLEGRLSEEISEPSC